MFDGLDRLHIRFPNLVVCWSKGGGLILSHTSTKPIYLFSLSSQLSKKHSLLSDIVKGQEGQNDHKKLWLWQRDICFKLMCVSRNPFREDDEPLLENMRVSLSFPHFSLFFSFTWTSFCPFNTFKPKHADQHILTFCNGRRATIAFFMLLFISTQAYWKNVPATTFL